MATIEAAYMNGDAERASQLADELVEACKAVGMDDFVSKPLHLDAVRAVIQALVGAST